MYALQCTADPDFMTQSRPTIKEALERVWELSTEPCSAPHQVVEVDDETGQVTPLMQVNLLSLVVLTDPDGPEPQLEQLKTVAEDAVTRHMRGA